MAIKHKSKSQNLILARRSQLKVLNGEMNSNFRWKVAISKSVGLSTWTLLLKIFWMSKKVFKFWIMSLI